MKSLILSAVALSAVCAKHGDHKEDVKNHDSLHEKGKCYGLALGDGVDLGPYQAGVMAHFSNYMR